MLSKSQRLSTKQFDLVMEKGRVAHSPFFLVRWLSTDEKTRIVGVVSQKVAKTAVGRGTLRRKIYRAVGPIHSSLKSGIHMIIFAKNPAQEAEAAVLEADLKQLFVKAQIMR